MSSLKLKRVYNRKTKKEYIHSFVPGWIRAGDLQAVPDFWHIPCRSPLDRLQLFKFLTQFSGYTWEKNQLCWIHSDFRLYSVRICKISWNLDVPALFNYPPQKTRLWLNPNFNKNVYTNTPKHVTKNFTLILTNFSDNWPTVSNEIFSNYWEKVAKFDIF